MNAAEFCLALWGICIVFVASGYVGDAAFKHDSKALDRVAAMLRAASTVGLLALGVALHMMR